MWRKRVVLTCGCTVNADAIIDHDVEGCRDSAVSVEPYVLTKRADDYDPENAVPAPSCWPLFRAVAKRLKAAEIEYRAAQQAYGEVVKQLSEEAVK